MNTKVIMIVGVVLGLAIASLLIRGKKNVPETAKDLQQDVQFSFEPQTNSEGSVEVEVAPIEISNSSDSWQFRIVLNTHSVELNQDLTKVVTLYDDKGKEYKPSSWEGTPPGGHHREGILTFRSLIPRPSSITLVVKDIDGIPERKFSWNL